MDASVSAYRVKSVEVSYQVAGRLNKAGDKGRPGQRCTILEEANLVAREPRPRATANRVNIGLRHYVRPNVPSVVDGRVRILVRLRQVRREAVHNV
jgi:hypothetical protein